MKMNDRGQFSFVAPEKAHCLLELERMPDRIRHLELEVRCNAAVEVSMVLDTGELVQVGFGGVVTWSGRPPAGFACFDVRVPKGKDGFPVLAYRLEARGPFWTKERLDSTSSVAVGSSPVDGGTRDAIRQYLLRASPEQLRELADDVIEDLDDAELAFEDEGSTETFGPGYMEDDTPAVEPAARSPAEPASAPIGKPSEAEGGGSPPITPPDPPGSREPSEST